MKYKVIEDFSWAHSGVDVKQYKKGNVIDTDEADLISVALSEGWIEKSGKSPELSNKAHQSSPGKKSIIDKVKDILK